MPFAIALQDQPEPPWCIKAIVAPKQVNPLAIFQRGKVPSSVNSSIDFGIVVPLTAERDATLAYLKGYTQITDDAVSSRTYYRCAIPLAKGGRYEIAVVMLPQMGNVQSRVPPSIETKSLSTLRSVR